MIPMNTVAPSPATTRQQPLPDGFRLGQSTLFVGHRGSGKTLAVEEAIERHPLAAVLAASVVRFRPIADYTTPPGPEMTQMLEGAVRILGERLENPGAPVQTLIVVLDDLGVLFRNPDRRDGYLIKNLLEAPDGAHVLVYATMLPQTPLATLPFDIRLFPQVVRTRYTAGRGAPELVTLAEATSRQAVS